MEKVLARLERKLGRFAIENLATYLVGGMALVFVLTIARKDFPSLLDLDPALIKQGQVWRLVTFLFLPEDQSPWWILFALYWTWLLGRTLENEWGAFKFNVYYATGVVCTTIAAFAIGGGAGNYYINLSLLFAFATLFPNYQILLLIIPIRVKWLALFAAARLVYGVVVGDWGERAAIGASLVNYFLFFGPELYAMVMKRNTEVRQAARRAGTQAQASSEAKVKPVGKACAICGARADDGADIRVCTCAKCGGPRSLCLEHARNH